MIGIANHDQLQQYGEHIANENVKRSISAYTHHENDLYQCRYEPDLGADSDPESQVSLSDGGSSQDSDVTSQSPASSSSEDFTNELRQYRSRSPAGTPKGLCQTWDETISQQISTASSSHLTTTVQQYGTCNVPFRPKPESEPQKSTHLTDANANLVQRDSNAIQSSHNVHETQCRRRRGRSNGTPVAVPSLKRDTDHTDTIVRMIVIFCTNLINSIWCTGGAGSTTAAATSGSNVLPLQIFITETLRRSKTSYSTLQIALYYLILLKQCLPQQSSANQSGCRAMQCGRRMFLTSLILASKYLQDRNYSARAWSKISGLPLKEINDNERRYLSIVCWDLHVPKSTFENWSKIVLYVCRRSMDPDVGASYQGGMNQFPPGSGSSGSVPRQCALANMTKDVEALRNWWQINLNQLKTDIVKCGVKTQQYVESIVPFRQGPYLPRPISPDFTSDEEDKFSQPLLSQDYKSALPSRSSSVERSSTSFEPVADLLHPAAPMVMPPPPVMKNLPTPQTTPQADLANWWTPKLGGQSSKPGARCLASAAALGNVFRKHCPIANLETCPPPQPRSESQVRRQYQLSESTPAASTPLTSSPESYVSDISSFGSRSRSSSISSTASWMTSSSSSSSSSANICLKESQDIRQHVQQLACQRAQLLSRRAAPLLAQSIERPLTAFKVEDGAAPGISSSSDRFTDEGYVSDEQARRKQEADRCEAAHVLALLRMDETATRSRAIPKSCRTNNSALSRCPTQSSDPKVQYLKRSRSDTADLASQMLLSDLISVPPHHPETTKNDSGSRTVCPYELTKEIQHPSQPWAAPRRPLQKAIQNKRLALQTSVANSAADLAGSYLKYEMQSSRLGAACH